MTEGPANQLFPLIMPFQTGYLARSGEHEIYYELAGNPNGRAVTFLHGGPGSGCAEVHRRYFDPSRHLIILFDQRGSGRSRPNALLSHNSTSDLVDDFRALLDHLDVSSVGVVGASWGTTLAVAFAEKHPSLVKFLALTGVYLGTESETKWWYAPEGVGRFFPEAYRTFVQSVPTKLRTDWRAVVAEYQASMEADRASITNGSLPFGSTGADVNQLRKSPIYRWTEYETMMSYMETSDQVVADTIMARGKEYLLGHSLIEAHYFANNCFLKDGELLLNVERISDIPMSIVQSSYDMICPPGGAYLLHERCPSSRLVIVGNSGHALNPTSQPHLVKAIRQLSDINEP